MQILISNILCICCIPTMSISQTILIISFINTITVYAYWCISITSNHYPNAICLFSFILHLSYINPLDSFFTCPSLFCDVFGVVGVLVVVLAQSLVHLPGRNEVNSKWNRRLEEYKERQYSLAGWNGRNTLEASYDLKRCRCYLHFNCFIYYSMIFRQIHLILEKSIHFKFKFF